MNRTESGLRHHRPSTSPSQAQTGTPLSKVDLLRQRSLCTLSSPFSLLRRSRTQVGKQSAALYVPHPARADPESVPCSPTLSIYTAGLSTTNRIAFHTPPLFSESAPSTQAPLPIKGITMNTLSNVTESLLSSSPYLLTNNDDQDFNKDDWRMEKGKRSWNVPGWLSSQQEATELSDVTATIYTTLQSDNRRRHRAYSESSTAIAPVVSNTIDWSTFREVSIPSKSVLRGVDSGVQIVPEHLLSSILDCSQDDDEIEQRYSASPSSEIESIYGTSALSMRYFGAQSTSKMQTIEDDRKSDLSTRVIVADGLASVDPVSFSVICNDAEGSFTVSESELERLQYSELLGHCLHSLGDTITLSTTTKERNEDRLFLILSSVEAIKLKLIQTEMDTVSCNLVLLDPWLTNISTSMQELLIKDNFRQTNQREERVRLFLLEGDQGLPHQIRATKSFWSGWSSAVSFRNQEMMRVTIQSGVAPIHSSCCSSSSPSAGLNSMTNCKDETKEEVQDCFEETSPVQSEENRLEEQSSSLHHVPSILSSRFSIESVDDNAYSDLQLKNKRKNLLRDTSMAKRSVQLSVECGFRFGSSKRYSVRHSKVVSMKSPRNGCQRDKRLSVQVVGSNRKSSKLMFGNRQRGLSTIETHSVVLAGLKQSNKALRKAAGFLARSNVLAVGSKEDKSEDCLVQLSKEHIADGTNGVVRDNRVEGEVLSACSTGRQGIKEEIPIGKRRDWICDGDPFTAIDEVVLEEEEEHVRESIDTKSSSNDEQQNQRENSIINIGELFEEEKSQRSRSSSISSFFKSSFSSPPQKSAWQPSPSKSMSTSTSLTEKSAWQASPSKSMSTSTSLTETTMESFKESSILRRQLFKMGSRIRGMKRSKSDEGEAVAVVAANDYSIQIKNTQLDWQADGKDSRESTGASISLYSTSSAEYSPFTRASSTEDGSPSCTLAAHAATLFIPESLFGQLQQQQSGPRLLQTSVTPSLCSPPRPPRKFPLHAPASLKLTPTRNVTASSTSTLSRIQSVQSVGWMCSDEDLEPEVRDCVSTLSGGLDLFQESNLDRFKHHR